MPEWNRQVVEAFETLNLDIDDATLEQAAKAYKTQAIRHHPDKNPGDPAATQRFQKLGAAWDTCQRHFEDPESSYVNTGFKFDDGDLDDDDFEDMAYFMFLFEEAINQRYARSRRNYRGSRGQGPQVFVSPFGFGFSSPSPSYRSASFGTSSFAGGGYPGERQLNQPDYNQRNQAKKTAAYEERLREFEKEIENEKRELHRQAKEKSRDEDKRAAAYQQAFQAARAGKAALVMSLVDEYDLDVNGPEKMPRASDKTSKVTSKKAEKPANFQTLLHAACRVCDEGLIIFLLDKGATPDALNDAKFTPFHVAISCGNVAAVKFFLLRRVHGKPTPGCHPSKAAADGRSPLQIAITSEHVEMVTIMTQQATVHDVEKCWLQHDSAPFRSILLEKKGFVDPETKEFRREEEERKAAEDREIERQRLADEKARLAEKARLKEERQKRAAEQKAREEEKRREEAESVRQKKEAEERKAELERIAAEAQRRKEQEEAEAQRRKEQEEAEVQRRAEKLAAEAAEARRKAEKEAAARRKASQQEAVEARRRVDAEREAEARRRAEQEAEEVEAKRQAERAEAHARQLAAEQERARQQAEEESRLRKAAKAQAAAVRREAEAEARRQTTAQTEAPRPQQTATECPDKAALEQQRIERKRAETVRRLQAQAEEHRRVAEAKVHASSKIEQTVQNPTKPLIEDAVPTTEQGRKHAKKLQSRNLSQPSPEELQKRAAQSARDKARIAEEKRLKMLAASVQTRPDTPESLHRGQQEEYIPPTPVSMPSPTRRRLSPPLVPHHTRPNVPARKMDSLGVVLLGPEDVQTITDEYDLFAPAPVAARGAAAAAAAGAAGGSGGWSESDSGRLGESGPPPSFRGRGRGGYRARGFRARGRGRGRGVSAE
ncbi:hypothetical protein K438DRAFT_1837338 [Mycena galopus ATCC 62051]|nr:hypothetical protein K438DRAFT_1837338 [Mycena galopus ATCC 62051]